MPKFKLFAIFTVIIFLLVSIGQSITVKAVISSCTGNASPQSIAPNITGDITFSIHNHGGTSGVWVRINAPSTGFSIQTASASGWTAVVDSPTQVTFTGGSLLASSVTDFSMSVAVGSAQAAAAWTVKVSDDAGGSSPTTCGGDNQVTIADTSEPVISAITISELNDTSGKINWTTDEVSNSRVDYGTTVAYGSSKTDSSMVTSHSLDISSLTANTTYHVKITSVDSSGNTAESGDFTFATAKTSTTTTVTITKTETKTVEKLIEDTEKPGISFTTKFDKPFSATPEISGKVTDNAGVSEIEYSIDGGANYLPVDELSNPKEKSTNFQFSIYNLLDGNYRIRVRATDLAGNAKVSEEKMLIFDRLPPKVGGVVYSLGSQILAPSENGQLVTIAGLDQKVTLSAVGGPTELEIRGIRVIGEIREEKSQLFSLTKNPDTGLWSGTLSFTDPGKYILETRAVDGAGNETAGSLGGVVVLPKGSVTFAQGPTLDRVGPLTETEISVYYYEPTTQQFTLWDAVAYGQENPIKVDINGNYSLTLPSGKYYLEVSSQKSVVSITEIFTLDRVTPVNTNLSLVERKVINLGFIKLPLPEIFQPELKIQADLVKQLRQVNQEENQLIGKEIPYFELKGEGDKYDSFYFRGKPTIYTFLNSWHPSASEQISVIDELMKETKFNYVIIMPQESQSKVEVYKKMGKYEILILADPDGEFSSQLKLSNLPAHIITDNKGIVKNIVVGALGGEEIIDRIL